MWTAYLSPQVFSGSVNYKENGPSFFLQQPFLGRCTLSTLCLVMSPVQQSLPRSSEDFYLISYQQHLCFVAILLVIVPVKNVPRVRKDALQIHTAKAQGPVSLSFRCYPILQMISLPKRLLCLKKSCQCPFLLSHCNYSIPVHPPCPLLGITRHFLHP